MQSKKFNIELGGKELSIEISKLAERANGAVIARLQDTVVMATAVMSPQKREGVNFLPLTVEFEERLYAAGYLRRSRFMKREGRPSEEATLIGRMIDRAIRPRFNQKMRNEVQIVVTVLSLDEHNSADILGLIATSCALSISDIPWDGPVAGVKIGKVEGSFILNPNFEQTDAGDLELVVAGTKDRINMLEAKANQIPEKEIAEAAQIAKKEIEKLVDWQQEIVETLKPVKQEIEIEQASPELTKLVKDFIAGKLEEALYVKEETKQDKLSQLKEDLFSYLEQNLGMLPENPQTLDEIKDKVDDILDEEINQIVHRNILEKEKRPDGRALKEIRSIECQVGILPRVHGSGLFMRGTTHALSTVTLGSPREELYLDSLSHFQQTQRFFHHYNFPPYCTGEVKRMGGPGRREIGHGHLAEKALMAIIPKKEEFPYTIRVVSEILSSNGSSSMASVCGSSLALMDAGVPIKEAAAGIALGLMSSQQSAISNQQSTYKILTDIQGPEDHHGDMDLKAAGTKNGICALQMDVKIEGITIEILEKVLNQAKEARMIILEKMTKTISQSRKELSEWAPKILTLQINPEKIRDVIGPGGRTINQIIGETGVEIDVEDSGLVFVTSKDKEAAQKAIEWIKNLTREVKIGEIFQGRITRILNFGAFAEILPGQEGLIHISQLAPYHVHRVEDIVKVGDMVPVRVKNIDELGRINLSMLSEEQERQAANKPIKKQGFKKSFGRKRKPFKS